MQESMGSIPYRDPKPVLLKEQLSPCTAAAEPVLQRAGSRNYWELVRQLLEPKRRTARVQQGGSHRNNEKPAHCSLGVAPVVATRKKLKHQQMAQPNINK